VEQIRELAPDVIVVVGYGQILPQSILDIPPQGTINVHASLLPKYRGAAPIQWAVAHGEARTGVTTMLLNAGLDTGDMLLKWETEIGAEETAVELGQRLAIAGADLLVRTLAELPSIRPEPQDHSQATYAPILKKEDGHIDWSLPARDILNRIRGFEPWPGCYGFLRGQRLHIWKAVPAGQTLPPASLTAEHRHLLAGCGAGALDILEVQMEGKKRMPAAAFLNGFALQPNEVFA
jgi:methionyl-tRNA formyltransferase